MGAFKRYNSTTGQWELATVVAETNSSWVSGVALTGVIDGNNKDFYTPTPFTFVSLYKNGIRLREGATNDYVIQGDKIVFNTAPATGTVLTADYGTRAQLTVNGSNSFSNNETVSGAVDGVNKAYTVQKLAYVPSSIAIYVNGLKLAKVHYAETNPSAGIFTLVDAPLAGDVIAVDYQYTTGTSTNADTVDGFHASSTPTAGQIPVLDSNAKLPYDILATQVDTDANGWRVETKPDGKKIWTKSGIVTGLSLPAGLSYGNGTITSTPVGGITGASLWSSGYVVTESLVLDGNSRHVIPHTIFPDSAGTVISYGLINAWTGGGWSGSLSYNYRIEQV